MKVTLTQLTVFTALCETLHFTRAADSLGLTQPTVSKEIRTLERTLGLTLFARSAGGTQLTAAGRALEPHARSVLTEVDRLVQTAAQELRRAAHQVTLAASPSVVNRLLPETLRRIDDAQLPTHVTALEVETGGVIEAVETGAADIGVGHYLGDAGQFVKRQLGEDELHVLVHGSLLRPLGASVALSDLSQLPLLMWPRDRSPGYYDAMIDVCRQRGLEPLVLTGTTRLSGSWSYFLADGRAFALAPRDYAEREARGDLVALPLAPPAFVPLEGVWKPRPSGETKQVLEILVEVTKSRRR